MTNIKSPQLEKLEERKAELDRKIRDIKNKEAAKKRKEDNKRKILIGAAVIEQIKNGNISQSQLDSWLDASLTRKADRDFFGLPTRG